MKKIKDTEYAFITPFVRAREAKLISWEQVQRMLDAPTVQEAAAVAEEFGYAGLAPISAGRLESALNARRAEIFGELRKLTPQQALVDAFCLKYDYHNAKVAVKAAAAGQDAKRLLSGAGRVAPDVLLEKCIQRDFGALPDTLGTAVETAADILARTGDPQQADFALDKAYFAELLETAREAGSAFLQGYAKLSVDEANLRAAVRARRMGKGFEFLSRVLAAGGNVDPDSIAEAVRGEKDLSGLFHGPLAQAAEAGEAALRDGRPLSAFEKLCDKALETYLDGANLIAFGEQPLIGYICAVEKEIKTIRVVLAGRLAGMKGEDIRERLRETNG